MPISRCDTAGFRLGLGLALLLTTWLALTPNPPPTPAGVGLDKWAHLATYLVLALLVDLSWPRRTFDPLKWGPMIVYGVLIEFIQSQIPNREFSLADILANVAGIALYGLALLQLLRRHGWR